MTNTAMVIEKDVYDTITAAADSGEHVCVRVGDIDPIATIWLNGGRIVAASAEGGEMRLGARLVATGHLSAAELRTATSAAAADGVALVQALTGRVRRDVLTAIARDEARYALAAALAAPPAAVGYGSEKAPKSVTKIALDPNEMLQETVEFLDAVRNAQAAVASDAVPSRSGRPGADSGLTPEEWAVVERCDGATSVAQIADACGMPHPEASLMIDRLERGGLVSVAGSLPGAGDLIAELEAAQDMAALAAVMEPQTVEPLLAEPEVYSFLPDAIAVDGGPTGEPAAFDTEFEHFEEEPHPVAHIGEVEEDHQFESAAGTRIDTQSLLRELASLGRDEPARR